MLYLFYSLWRIFLELGFSYHIDFFSFLPVPESYLSEVLKKIFISYSLYGTLGKIHIDTDIHEKWKSFEELFFQCQPKIVSFLTELTHDSELSRDITQKLFLSIWNDHEKLAQIKSIFAYLSNSQIQGFRLFWPSICNWKIHQWIFKTSLRSSDKGRGNFVRLRITACY